MPNMQPMKIDDEIALFAQLGVESYNSLINSMATDTEEKLNCTPKFAIPGACAFIAEVVQILVELFPQDIIMIPQTAAQKESQNNSESLNGNIS